MMKYLISILLLVFTVMPIVAQDTVETTTCPPDQTMIDDGGNKMFEVDVDGQARRYALFVPKSYDPEKAMPLVIVFAGATQSVDDIAAMSKWHRLGEEKGFMTAYPESVDGWWNDGVVTTPATLEIDDVAFAQSLIEDITGKWCVDKDRIFVSGASNGANMSARLICELSNEIAAAGVAGGGNFPFRDGCEPDRPVPIVIFFGTEDPVIPYEGGDSPYTSDMGFTDLPSVEGGVKAWAELYGCNPDPTEESITSEVSLVSYSNCDGEAEVSLYRVDGGGHTWPGSSIGGMGKINHDIDATALMWDFFVKHTP